mmetsp:Transcript_11594/g.13640  ORF Transcript_11594/g.13640 Transcript_11594/m.13640 type:complete len:120 (+) Transcript_11594:168-527(+)
MSDNTRNIRDPFSSLTGHIEREREALHLSEKGDDIGAMQMSRHVLRTRLYHADVPPHISSIDIANSHTALARILQKIIGKLRGVNANLHNKYRAEASTNYYAAWEITRTQEAWNLYTNV